MLKSMFQVNLLLLKSERSKQISYYEFLYYAITYLISCIAGGDMTYIPFSIITLITGIIMHMTMYFVKFECRKMPLFMTIIFTI